MRLHIKYKNRTLIVEANKDDTVGQLTQKVNILLKLGLQAVSPYQVSVAELQIICDSIQLPDHIILSDLPIASGTVLLCKQISRPIGDLHFRLAFSDHRIELQECSENTKISSLKIILQNKIGLPVSTFWLIDPRLNIKLFDNHNLGFYRIERDTSLTIHLWPGIRRIVQAALSNDILSVIDNIPKYEENPFLNQYILRVVLFIAAHYDRAKLAVRVLNQGGRCDEMVDEHPSRFWCKENSSREISKTPVHQAAQQGSFQCLDLFLRFNPSSVSVTDGFGLTPFHYATMKKQQKCIVLLVVAKLKLSKTHRLASSTQLRLLKWARSVQAQMPLARFDHKKGLHWRRIQFDKLEIGATIAIDGFTDKVTDNAKTKSLSIRKIDGKKSRKENNALRHGSLPRIEIESTRRTGKDNVESSTITEEPDRLPQLRERKKSDFSQDDVNSLIEKHTGRTTRELARESYKFAVTIFKNKPFMEQLKIALRHNTNNIYRSWNSSER